MFFLATLLYKFIQLPLCNVLNFYQLIINSDINNWHLDYHDKSVYNNCKLEYDSFLLFKHSFIEWLYKQTGVVSNKFIFSKPSLNKPNFLIDYWHSYWLVACN